ncbi:MAG: hypothetical protein A3E88_05330 [Legionellales bacterium RIFCSPHIGHO2_12_FULL_35_11]|nr:MAG: hypothetical protein A3E88_05330 [Legionellales bacterium RIFCSPHIGHO2_12_FULL_35_11]
METPILYSLALSQFFGLFLLVVAIVGASRPEYYRKVFASVKDDNPIIMLTATCGMLLGIVLIGSHLVYGFNRRFYVTIFSWFVFINSIFWLMMPEKLMAITKKITKGKGYYAAILFIAFTGFWFLFRGGEQFILK